MPPSVLVPELPAAGGVVPEPVMLPVVLGGEVCVVAFIGVLPVGAVIGDCAIGAVVLPVVAGVSTLPRVVVELLVLPAFEPDCA